MDKLTLSREHLNNYEDFTLSLLNPTILNGDTSSKLSYLVLKLSSETGELIGEICKEKFHSKPIEKSQYLDEIGDCLFYIFAIAGSTNKNNQHFYNEIISNNKSPADKLREPVISICLRLQQHLGSMSKYLYVSSNNFYSVFPEMRIFTHTFLQLLKVLKIDLLESIEYNKKKLRDRHGDQYNSRFYLGEKASV